MKKIRNVITSKVAITMLGVFAVAFIAFGTIGGAKAALTYYSETYSSQVEMHDIGVTLVENGQDISNRDYMKEYANGSWNENTGVLLARMLEESDGKLVLGKNYTEQLSVKNTGTIDSYVRVTIYKYWVDEEGNKTRDIDPSMIDLHLVNLYGVDGKQCWIMDETASTEERLVLYYQNVLPSIENSGSIEASTTPDFADSIRICGNIASHVSTVTNAEGVSVSTYDYNGYRFVLEATADAVQNHNAKDAILSAWGTQVEIKEQILSLCAYIE